MDATVLSAKLVMSAYAMAYTECLKQIEKFVSADGAEPADVVNAVSAWLQHQIDIAENAKLLLGSG